MQGFFGKRWVKIGLRLKIEDAAPARRIFARKRGRNPIQLGVGRCLTKTLVAVNRATSS
jgi:hypothetical protein